MVSSHRQYDFIQYDREPVPRHEIFLVDLATNVNQETALEKAIYNDTNLLNQNMP